MSPSTVCHTVFNDAPQRATANMLLAYSHTRASHHYQTATNTHHPLSRLVSHHHILSTIEIVTSALKLPSMHHLPQRLVRREARRPRGPWLSNA